MGRKMTARVVQRRAQVGLGIARMRRPGGPCPPLLPERADGRQAAKLGVGFCRGGFSWLPAHLRPWFPVVAPPVGGGEGGRVGGGRSDADAKVAASGHHFCARKLNPGLKVAAAPLAGCSASPSLLFSDYPEHVRILGL